VKRWGQAIVGMTIIYMIFPILALIKDPKSFFGEYLAFYLVCLVAPLSVGLALVLLDRRRGREDR
jgi:hypothetical protein